MSRNLDDIAIVNEAEDEAVNVDPHSSSSDSNSPPSSRARTVSKSSSGNAPSHHSTHLSYPTTPDFSSEEEPTPPLTNMYNMPPKLSPKERSSSAESPPIVFEDALSPNPSSSDSNSQPVNAELLNATNRSTSSTPTSDLTKDLPDDVLRAVNTFRSQNPNDGAEVNRLLEQYKGAQLEAERARSEAERVRSELMSKLNSLPQSSKANEH